jgi:hypothetical protein
MSGMGVLHLAVILAKSDNERMMTAVLHGPMITDDLREGFGPGGQAAQIVVNFLIEF